jgi:hypothetical protein
MRSKRKFRLNAPLTVERPKPVVRAETCRLKLRCLNFPYPLSHEDVLLLVHNLSGSL